ncbi:single-strand DNA-binding protein [Dyadobacter soli]|uniref:Single-stranded DNA-binding protein n=1 Tax=Dyadobacter soli TaxID=659014 RepID=A0A1G7ME17_9BACT|nr:single-stranded DNA-binding protein [Dyadobacter soli]SDF59369.1 single-strand DNA-binding protein [Dyadobacter soli]
MEITGRITRDAVVAQLKDERSVINFTVAVGDGYRDKQGSWVDRTEFVSCAFWLNAGAAKLLKKGAVVQLYGRMSARVWHGSDGEAKAGLQFHTAAFKLISSGVSREREDRQRPAETTNSRRGKTNDEPPF